jgi:hypothetical protein
MLAALAAATGWYFLRPSDYFPENETPAPRPTPVSPLAGVIAQVDADATLARYSPKIAGKVDDLSVQPFGLGLHALVCIWSYIAQHRFAKVRIAKINIKLGWREGREAGDEVGGVQDLLRERPQVFRMRARVPASLSVWVSPQVCFSLLPLAHGVHVARTWTERVAKNDTVPPPGLPKRAGRTGPEDDADRLLDGRGGHGTGPLVEVTASPLRGHSHFSRRLRAANAWWNPNPSAEARVAFLPRSGLVQPTLSEV